MLTTSSESRAGRTSYSSAKGAGRNVDVDSFFLLHSVHDSEGSNRRRFPADSETFSLQRTIDHLGGANGMFAEDE